MEVLVVSKVDNEQHATFTLQNSLAVELPSSSIRVRTLLVSLTSNNLTYARGGHSLHWWDTYPVPTTSPTPYNDTSSWGIVPAWGYAVVLESTITSILQGAVLNRTKWALDAAASFMQNFKGAMAPHSAGDGTYTISNVVRPDTPFPLIDIVSDAGKFVGEILADPDQYAGKTLSGAVGLYSLAEIAKIISTATGKSVQYVQIPDDVFRGFLPPPVAADFSEMMLFIDEFGYYGPKQSELVSWSTKQVRGQLTTLEEFLKKFPLNL